MDYALFFTTDGKALHQYHGIANLTLLRFMRRGSDFIGSHGCVRLQQTDARALYNWAEIGTPVIVRR